MRRKMFLAAGIFLLTAVMVLTNYAYAQEPPLRPFSVMYETRETWYRPFPVIHEKQEAWFRPFLLLMGTYDDNIYLTNDDEKTDWIATVSPGFIFEPELTRHKFSLDYRADLEFFLDYDNEDTDNHTTNAALKLDFNTFDLDFANMFHYFSDRSGSEDIERVPRTQDYAQVISTFDFNKLDMSLGYYYNFEHYRSDNAIGDFQGQSLTYKDLERDEHRGEIGAAFKLWPKTALLLSGDYGVIDHDTGKKSDSEYFDGLIGLRGKPTAKCTVEGKVGYREQDYENYDDDFDGLIFDGSLVEVFSSRDIFRLDFLRRTTDTIYKDNAYYKNSFIGAGYKHSFTDRVFGNLNFYYQRNGYPTATTEGGKTAKRKDDLWSGSIGLGYEFPKRFTVSLIYEYRIRESNFPIFDYKNNRISAALTASF